MAKQAKILVALAVLTFLAPILPARAADPDARILFVLNRLAFGPSARDFAYVKKIGVVHYIEEQLDPQSIEEPFDLRLKLAALDTLGLDPAQLRRLYGPPPPVMGVKPNADELKAQRLRARIIVREARAARLYRAIESRRQLEQVMVELWSSHFNVFAGKGLDQIWIGNYEERAIRPYALGRFRDLLLATARHPAMLVYLDNARNVARGNKPEINENYAREVMELHTLGVDGGYSQEDIDALARIFTGWGLNPPNSQKFPDHEALFKGPLHDDRPEVFLGRTIPAGGKEQGERALDILADSPATAHHIAYELAQYFVADEPPPTLVQRLAARFLETHGEIRAVLATLFASPEFWASAGDKYKTPYQYVISAVRAAGVPVVNSRPLDRTLAALGMPLYGCQTPDGYKNTESAWLSPGGSLRRIAFATALAHGALPLARAAVGDGLASEIGLGAPASGPVDAGRLEELLGPLLSAHTKAAVAAAPPQLRAALILGSPDFMMR
jgi:hypothetical protein